MSLNFVAGQKVGKSARRSELRPTQVPNVLSCKAFLGGPWRLSLPEEVGGGRGAPVALLTGMTQTLRKRRPIDARGEQILRAATDEFIQYGFRESSIARIARNAGVSPRVLSQYFASSGELFQEVVRTLIVAQLRAGESWRVPSEGEWSDRLVTWQRRYAEVMHRREGRALARWSREEFQAFPELALFYRSELIERAISEVERLVGRGMGRDLVEDLLR